MSQLIQELLAINESRVLMERVDNMLERLKTHFSNANNTNPAKVFSKEDLVAMSYQLVGLNFILSQSDLSKKLPELADGKMLMTFLNQLDEPNQRKLFNNRAQTADEFLVKIGQQNDAKGAKVLLKAFEELKALKNINGNSREIVSYVSKLEVKLNSFLKSVK